VSWAEAELDAVPLLTTAETDVARAQRVTFLLEQRFCYTYDGPVRDLDHRLVVIPRGRHGNARRLHSRVDVSAANARSTTTRDRLGNVATRIRICDVADSVCFEVAAVV